MVMNLRLWILVDVKKTELFLIEFSRFLLFFIFVWSYCSIFVDFRWSYCSCFSHSSNCRWKDVGLVNLGTLELWMAERWTWGRYSDGLSDGRALEVTTVDRLKVRVVGRGTWERLGVRLAGVRAVALWVGFLYSVSADGNRERLNLELWVWHLSQSLCCHIIETGLVYGV